MALNDVKNGAIPMTEADVISVYTELGYTCDDMYYDCERLGLDYEALVSKMF